MRYILDTSAVLAHYRQEPGWEGVQELFERDDAELIIASVTLTEFARRLRDLGASEAEIVVVLTNYQLLFMEVVAIDATIAMAAFFVSCRTPRILPLVDALIAATAQSRNGILVHRDEHMRAIPADVVPQQALL